MFKTKNYKVTFQHKGKYCTLEKGDTACYIFTNNENIPYVGVARLHPNDRFDKVIGKKIALTKCLTNSGISKPERTEIWKAFWEWVTSWEIQSDIVKRTPQNPV